MIASIDYIKRPEVMRSLETLLWDVVVLDEAHHLAGRSDRAAAGSMLGDRARALVLLTATPHSGDDEASRALLARQRWFIRAACHVPTHARRRRRACRSSGAAPSCATNAC